MEKVNLVELAKHIVSLQRDIFAEIRRSGKINPEKATLLADCRDYCACNLGFSLYTNTNFLKLVPIVRKSVIAFVSIKQVRKFSITTIAD
jgi:hypothetical protein